MDLGFVALLLLAGVAFSVHGLTTPSSPAFFLGVVLVAIAIGPLAFVAGRRKLPALALKIGIFLSVYLVAMLALELVWRSVEGVQQDAPVEPVLTYEEARANPAAFHRWWNLRASSFIRILHYFSEPDPTGQNPYVLKRNHTFRRHQSDVHINSLGFRGAEFDPEKGDLFRIVALGESTTFGLTLLADDRPWPELLEERIRAGYACDRPVQVINAGVPGWNLGHQVRRLDSDILPLEPDVVLTYHGYNGFDLFLTQLPPVRIHAPPSPRERPSRIVSALEQAVRRWWFRRRYRAARAFDPAALDVDPERNEYAVLYEKLIAKDRAAGATTVLATFDMAVDAESPEEVIRFYEESVPDVRARIVANGLHTEILHAIGSREGVTVIDTSPGLDGAYARAYIDIAHFTQEGREQLADNLLAGLDPLLRTHPRLRCRPRGAGSGG